MPKNSKNLYFSAGALLTALFSCRKTVNENGTITDADVFISLMSIIDEEFITNHGENIKSAVSNYKNCGDNGASYFPINNDTKMDAFSTNVQKNYSSLITEAAIFVDNYIDSNKDVRKKLVSSLVEIISMDNAIGMEDFKNNVKQKSMTLFDLIINSLANIYKYRKNNTLGIELLNEITVEKSGKKLLKSEIGKSNIENIKINQISFNYKQYKKVNVTLDDSENNTEVSYDFSIYKEYLDKTQEKYNKVKTLFYDQPHNFYDFYVCNTLSTKIRRYQNHTSFENKIIVNPNVVTLGFTSRYIIISGVGGIGKSMMMRNLLLDAIKNIQTYKIIPLFITIKDYHEEYQSIFEYLYKKISILSNKITCEILKETLENGKAVLLLDGLDELNEKNRIRFEEDLEDFIDTYTNNQFIISSRPHPHLKNLSRFYTISIEPFNKQQAIHLINKLDFRPDEPSIKENFIEKLNKTYFDTHREFAENPLLLTIMLMTFEEYANFPEKMYLFYREAYTVLTKKHDATKIGYVRELSCKITAERFSDYFAEFSAITYTDYGFELSYDDVSSVFNKMKTVKADNKHITVDDFINDLTINTCLMFYEDNSYHFIHRSFQEYFCALFFSKQKDKYLLKIAETFCKKFQSHTDKTFDMLFDMIKPKIEEYVILPYLKHLLEKCDYGNDYWKYVAEYYPSIRYTNGETDGWPVREADSFLLAFIIRNYRIRSDFEDSQFPFIDDFVTEKYAYWDTEYWDDESNGDYELSNIDDIDDGYFEKEGDPDIVGYELQFETKTLIENREKYSEIISVMEQPDFAYKIQIADLSNLYSQLNNKYNNKHGSIFDLLED